MKLLKKHYNTVLFFVTIIVVGIILGLILGIKQGPIFKNDLIYSTSNLKNAILTNNVNNTGINIVNVSVDKKSK